LTFVPTWAVSCVCLLHHRRFLPDDCRREARQSHAQRDDPGRDRNRSLGRGTHLEDLRRHSDAGSQFTSIREGEPLTEIGATPSIGTVGDSYDNALAETVNGHYKTELVRGHARPGPWKTVEDLELATLSWVHWHNTQRLRGYLGDIPPAEFETAFIAEQIDHQQEVEIK
jgi:putative transposase